MPPRFVKRTTKQKRQQNGSSFHDRHHIASSLNKKCRAEIDYGHTREYVHSVAFPISDAASNALRSIAAGANNLVILVCFPHLNSFRLREKSLTTSNREWIRKKRPSNFDQNQKSLLQTFPDRSHLTNLPSPSSDTRTISRESNNHQPVSCPTFNPPLSITSSLFPL